MLFTMSSFLYWNVCMDLRKCGNGVIGIGHIMLQIDCSIIRSHPNHSLTALVAHIMSLEGSYQTSTKPTTWWVSRFKSGGWFSRQKNALTVQCFLLRLVRFVVHHVAYLRLLHFLHFIVFIDADYFMGDWRSPHPFDSHRTWSRYIFWILHWIRCQTVFDFPRSRSDVYRSQCIVLQSDSSSAAVSIQCAISNGTYYLSHFLWVPL